jgi:hypothetical protein
MPIFAFVVVVIALALPIVVVNDKLRHARWRVRRVIPRIQTTRFRNPDFSAVETRISGEFARSFKDFYTRDRRVTMQELTIAHPSKGPLRLASFIPCDRGGVEESIPRLWERQFPFALVEKGGYLIVPLGRLRKTVGSISTTRMAVTRRTFSLAFLSSGLLTSRDRHVNSLDFPEGMRNN